MPLTWFFADHGRNHHYWCTADPRPDYFCHLTFTQFLARHGQLDEGNWRQMSGAVYAMYVFDMLITPLVALLGTVSNVLILLIMSREKRSSITVLFSVLAVLDTVYILLAAWMGLGGDPSGYDDLTDAIAPRYFDSSTRDFYQRSYWMVFILIGIAKTGAIYTTLLMTFERFFVICLPMRFVRFLSLKKTVAMTTALVVGSAVYNAGMRYDVYNWDWICDQCDGKLKPYVYEKYENYRVIDGKLPVPLRQPVADLLVEFLFPWTLLLILNLFIIITLRRASKKRRSLSTSSDSSKDTEITLCLVIVVIAFFVLESCRQAYLLLKVFTLLIQDNRHIGTCRDTMIMMDASEGTLMLARLLSVISSSINLYIYLLTGKRFRKTFVELISCRQKDTKNRSTETPGKKRWLKVPSCCK